MEALSLLAGRYRYERELGRGGAGRVLGARDSADTDADGQQRRVAVKVVAPDAFPLLRSEREVLDRLRHEHLVRVRELLRVDHAMSVPWSLPARTGVLVEEFVDGETTAVFFDGLADEARVERAGVFALQLCLALQAVHDAGLVHGDIKPSNVMVRAGEPMLVDFGLAGPPRARAPHVSGTPAFMAPECSVGVRNTATDLYAFGRTLQRWVEGAPVSPSLREVLSQLTEADPAHRFGSAQDVAVALSAALDLPKPARDSRRRRRNAPLHLPFVGQAKALDALASALDREESLVVVAGPPGAGRTRLVQEAVRRRQLECAQSGTPIPTFVLGASYPRQIAGASIQHIVGALHAPAAQRAIRAARVAGHTMTVIWQPEAADDSTLAPWKEQGAHMVPLAPMSDADFGKLFEEAKSAGLTLSRADAKRRSGGLAGTLCRLAHGAPRVTQLPEGSQEAALRLALAGGALDDDVLGDATGRLVPLVELGLVTVRPGGAWELRDDLIAPILDGTPVKRRRAIAESLTGRTARQRAHLARHREALDAADRFVVALEEALGRGQHDAVERVYGEAAALGIDDARCAEVAMRSRSAAGRYETALELAVAPADKAELLRKAGRREEALAALADAPKSDARAAYTRAWLALVAGEERAARDAIQMTLGPPRAELAAWAKLAEGNTEEAAQLVRGALSEADPRWRARLLSTLGTALRQTPREAEVAFAEGRGLARMLGEDHLLASIEGNLGAVYLAQGQLGPARVAMRDAARQLVLLGRQRDVGRALYNLAQLELVLGLSGPAASHYAQALEAAEEARDVEGVELIRVGLAETRALRGDLQAARKLAPTLTFKRARARLAASIAGADPDTASTLIAGEDEDDLGVDGQIAAARIRMARGLDAQKDARRLLEGGLSDWEDELHATLLACDAFSGAARDEVRARARSLLDIATATLAPEVREQMRQMPAYARVLDAHPAPLSSPSGSRWRRLVRVSRALTACTREAFFGELCRAALELVDAERVCVVERRDDGSFHTLCSRGVVSGAGAVSRSVVARALDTRDVVRAMDALTDEHFGAASVHALSLRSLLCLALPQRSIALYVEDRLRPAAFSEEDASIIVDLVEMGALVLSQKERAEDLVTANAELSALRVQLEERAQSQVAELHALREAPVDLVAKSPPMRRLVELVQRLAASDITVLFHGESGTGKSTLARFLHEQSARAAGPFVSESCGAIVETLLESILFGHVAGAFTGADSARVGLFEAADGGTLFLDEVGEMSPAMQASLLRVVQEGEVRRVGGTEMRKVNVRLVAATNQDLAKRVEQGLFREDLYYRLSSMTVDVPPLRARKADIAPLVRRWAEARDVGVTRNAITRLEAQDWPGNLRQLLGELERAHAVSEQPEQIDIADLSERLQRDSSALKGDFKSQVEELERQLITSALHDTGGNLTRAAQQLGLSRYGLQKMVKRLGVER